MAARRKADEHALEAEKWRRLADAYEKGDLGEQHVAGLLDVLDGAGWVVLNDRYKSAGSPANIDHILVGPPGICVIDTKNWTGNVTVDAEGLRCGGRRRDDVLRQVREQAMLVGQVARMSVPRVVAAPALCFVGQVGIAAPVYEHGVVLLQADQLLTWLTSLPHNLQPQEVAQLEGSLSAHFWPRTEPRSRLTVPSGPPITRAARPPSGSRRRQPVGRRLPVRRRPSLGELAVGLVDDFMSLLTRLVIFIVAAILCLTILPRVLQAVLVTSMPSMPSSPPSPVPRVTAPR